MLNRTHTKDFQYFRDNAPLWMTDEAINTLMQGYLTADETPNELYHRLAYTAAGYYPKGLGNASRLDIYADLYQAFNQGWFSPATPVASNFGVNFAALPVSCVGLIPENSIFGIFETAKEAALLTKYGSGLGINLSNLVGGSKVVDWAKVYNLVADVVAQGNNQRRGAVALYCDIHHPDIDSFLNARDLLSGDHREKVECNIAVIIDRKFIEAFKSGDKKAGELWARVLNLRMKYGNPYIQFSDNCWDADPGCYKALKMKSGAMQLCVGGDTRVSVYNQGNPCIRDLVGKTVTIFDGKNWVENSSFFSNGLSQVLEIELHSGSVIRMTHDHRCPVSRIAGDTNIDNFKIVAAKDLKVGDRLGESSETLAYRGSKDLWTTVVRITEVSSLEEVFCTTVPSTGMFALAHGIMTGNCNEITLYSDPTHTYTCVLSSLNAAKYEAWKDFQDKSLSGFSLPALGIIFLDAVNEEFILRGKGKEGLDNAVRSAEKGRPLGLGVLGLHSLYLSKMLPWSSPEAKALNIELFKFIDTEAKKASRLLARELGEPLWCRGFGIRNTHLTAVAPTTTNSLLCNGGSPGIEPIIANYFTMKGAKVTATRQNPYLTALLESKGKNTAAVWVSIRENAGSVAHLSFLTDFEKSVFLHGYELDQTDIVIQAADRQKYIDQGQSLNLFFKPTEDAQYISDVHFLAEKLGVKGLYYLRSENVLQNANRSQGIERVFLRTRDNCPYCAKSKELLDKHQIPYTTELKREGRVPEIWIAGEMLDDGYTSLLKRLDVLDVVIEQSDCGGCEG